MNAVIKVEATRIRLFLVIVVIGGAFLAASLLEQLLRRCELHRGWPRWYSRFNHPVLYRATADAPYSYVVLPQRIVPDWLRKRQLGRRSTAKLLNKVEAGQIAPNLASRPSC